MHFPPYWALNHKWDGSYSSHKTLNLLLSRSWHDIREIILAATFLSILMWCCYHQKKWKLWHGNHGVKHKEGRITRAFTPFSWLGGGYITSLRFQNKCLLLAVFWRATNNSSFPPLSFVVSLIGQWRVSFRPIEGDFASPRNKLEVEIFLFLIFTFTRHHGGRFAGTDKKWEYWSCKHFSSVYVYIMLIFSHLDLTFWITLFWWFMFLKWKENKEISHICFVYAWVSLCVSVYVGENSCWRGIWPAKMYKGRVDQRTRRGEA